MKRSGHVLAGLLAAFGCSSKAEPIEYTSVFGSVSPQRLAGWWQACPVPLTIVRPAPDARHAHWRFECHEELGGEQSLKTVPPVRGWGAIQRGWSVVTNRTMEIFYVGVIDTPDRFEERATTVIRTVMPAALHDAALRSLTIPPEPGEPLVSISLDVKRRPPQSAPLMQRFDAGTVYSATGISWQVNPVVF